MKKKDVIALSIIAAVFVFGGVGGFVWQIVKFRLDPPDFGGFNIKLFLLFVVMMASGGKLIKAVPDIGPSEINNMTGVQFENYVSDLLRKKGHSVQLTPKTGDYGVYLIMDGHVAIQCKRYGKSVGAKAIQEVYSGMQHYGCTSAIVATNSVFTANAKTLANELGVILWDGSTICRDI